MQREKVVQVEDVVLQGCDAETQMTLSFRNSLVGE